MLSTNYTLSGDKILHTMSNFAAFNLFNEMAGRSNLCLCTASRSAVELLVTLFNMHAL